MLKLRFYLADQNPHRDRSRGISVYTDGLLEQLRRDPELEISALTSRSSFQPRAGGPAIEVHTLPFRTDAPCRRLLADHLHPAMAGLGLPGFDRGTAPELWHFPKGFLPALKCPSAPLVGTVHDTILEHYATHHPKQRSLSANSYWLGLLARSLSRFDLVLTDSEFSRREIEAFCEKRRIACPLLRVAPLGARWEDDAGKAAAADDRVVHLISPLPHKRSDRLLSDWQRLQGERDTPRLHLIGQSNAPQRVAAAALRRVTASAWLPDDEFAQTLRSARALLLPSEIEGFGLPALEAYYLGTPVVYVKGTAVEEVLGIGSPGGFELDRYESFRAALDEVLSLDGAWVAAKAAELRMRHSWNECAQRTVAAYREVL